MCPSILGHDVLQAAVVVNEHLHTESKTDDDKSIRVQMSDVLCDPKVDESEEPGYGECMHLVVVVLNTLI